MDYIKFKPQTGFSSQAIELSTYDNSKRAGLKSIYSEALDLGQKVIIKEIYLDDCGMIMKMTLGIEENEYKSKIRTGIDKNTTFLNLFPSGYMLYAVLLEVVMLPETLSVFRVTINYGNQTGEDILPIIIDNMRLTDRFYFVPIDVNFTSDPVNVFSTNWIPGSKINISFLFKKL